MIHPPASFEVRLETARRLIARRGPALVTGDACRACADVLGIVREAAS
jgi:hypothetical protein